MKSIFTKESFFSIPSKDLFAFHERKDAFSLLTPPSHQIEVLSTASTLQPSEDVVRFVASFLFFKFPFEMVHTDYQRNVLFVDQQRQGLFSYWRHEHRFMEGGWHEDPASMLQDRIEFAHPLLPFFLPFVQHRLKGLFQFRHQVTQRETAPKGPEGEDAKAPVLVTGATGLIGKRVVEILMEKGIHVVAMVRDEEKARRMLGTRVQTVLWDFHRPERTEWKRYLDGAQGVIHLAGTPLFKQRWTPAFKREMEDSRVLSTRELVNAIKEVSHRPKVFVSASAVGIYGTDPDRTCDENAASADDLLARICDNWEAESRALDPIGVRNVQIRIGIVLSKESGALKELLLPFRTGLGGMFGSPHPWINWIHLEDVARVFTMALLNQDMKGPYNAAAPHPVRNRDFLLTLARVLKRPALMKYPVALLQPIIGEAAKYMSGGVKASSHRIQEAGYRFFFEDLRAAVENVMRS